MCRVGSLLAFVVVLLAPVTAEAGRKKVSGSIARSGKPVSDVELGWAWRVQGDLLIPGKTVKVDERGAFETDLEFGPAPRVLVAYDRERKFGGFAVIKEEEADRPVRIQLAPVTRLKGTLICPGLGTKLEDASVRLHAGEGSSLGIIEASLEGAEFVLPVPPGSYVLYVSSPYSEFLSLNITLKPSDRVTSLGRIKLTPTVVAKHYGKPPPAIQVSEARGVSPKVKLADYKGKWVLLEFWGYW
jgi:hypothetical protein